jgi:hypothetical protein
MKTAYAMTMILLAAVLSLTGCGKSKPPAAPTIQGVTVDIGKFQQAFNGASQPILTSVDSVRMGLRYGDYAAALAELDKLAANASLTETQKQAVALMTEQVKQVASKTPAPAPR